MGNKSDNDLLSGSNLSRNGANVPDYFDSYSGDEEIMDEDESSLSLDEWELPISLRNESPSHAPLSITTKATSEAAPVPPLGPASFTFLRRPGRWIW